MAVAPGGLGNGKITKYGESKHGFMGLVPESETPDGDSTVDGLNVIKKPGGSWNLRQWMADSQHPQPMMPDVPDLYEDEATPRGPESNTFLHPNISIPVPVLRHDFRMSVALNPRISIGKTPFGERKWISFTGGSWQATFGSGAVVPGGQDIQIITPNLSTRIETQYLLQTHDSPPAFIVAKTTGWRTGPPEVLASLADPDRAASVDPASYKFRLFIDLETGDERYRDKVNCGMWVGSGMRKGAEVIYDAYRIS